LLHTFFTFHLIPFGGFLITFHLLLFYGLIFTFHLVLFGGLSFTFHLILSVCLYYMNIKDTHNNVYLVTRQLVFTDYSGDKDYESIYRFESYLLLTFI